jgi:hypothetical protein
MNRFTPTNNQIEKKTKNIPSDDFIFELIEFLPAFLLSLFSEEISKYDIFHQI